MKKKSRVREIGFSSFSPQQKNRQLRPWPTTSKKVQKRGFNAFFRFRSGDSSLSFYRPSLPSPGYWEERWTRSTQTCFYYSATFLRISIKYIKFPSLQRQRTFSPFIFSRQPDFAFFIFLSPRLAKKRLWSQRKKRGGALRLMRKNPFASAYAFSPRHLQLLRECRGK